MHNNFYIPSHLGSQHMINNLKKQLLGKQVKFTNYQFYHITGHVLFVLYYFFLQNSL